ncbi:sialin-like isoform X2 [Hermetia illucens]|uniref:sialin-like isoform X2 n=1 Tax=Hermetia illucens TaxID=343691 RepID=UPI0018CBFBC2|nr:sialin-like isoform X2 [Hermetia illucens]
MLDANRLNGFMSNDSENDTLTWMFWKKRRYIIVLMAFFGYFMSYALRVNLSVAIVEMTKNRTVIRNNSIVYEQDVSWTSEQKGIILSSFFMGYIVTQGISGILSNQFVSNQIIGIGTGSTALLTLLSPIAVKAGFYVFLGLRILEGVMSGGTFPAMLALWSKWAPPAERSRMTAVAYCGIHFGIIITNVLSGFLATRFGWETVFYFTGCLGITWYIGWAIIVRSAPEKDRFCSTDEKLYIESQMDTKANGSCKKPWKAILTSGPVYACLLANFCDEVGGYTLMTQYPMFLKDVLSFDLESTGLISAAPYLAAGLLMGPAGWLADWLRLNTQMTTTTVRKLFNIISNIGKAGLMIGTAQLIPARFSVICITFILGIGAFGGSVNVTNPLDIAPQYASIICAIINTIGTIPGIVFPIITGYLTNVEQGVPSRWPTIFYTIAAIYLTGMTIYCIFGSGELQQWAKEPEVAPKQNGCVLDINKDMKVEKT